MKNKLLTILAVSLLAGPMAAQALVIIDNTTFGLYNSGLGDIHTIDGASGFLRGPNVSEGDPTIVLGADPSLNFSLFAAFGTNWLGGDYTGGSWSGSAVAIPTAWDINSETAIVYNFSLAATSNLHIDAGIDNGIIIWLDGVFLFGATSPGGADLNEYDIDALGVAAGTHSLQILRVDHGGSTGYAISVDATDAPVVGVPEPDTLALLGLGLVALGFAKRRKNA